MAPRCDDSPMPRRKATHVQFSILSPDEIRRMSVAEITCERAYEDGVPKAQGIADRRLGANGPSLPCVTCGGDDKGCPGHFGHVELAKPMYNIGFMNMTLKVLRCVCFYCSRILCRSDHVKAALAKKRPTERLKYISRACGEARRSCVGDGGCGNVQPAFSREGIHIRAVFTDAGEDSAERKELISAEKARAIFKVMLDEHVNALGLSAQWSRPEWLILTLLPVPPPAVRPSVMRGRMRAEDDLTNKLGDIVKMNNALRDLESTGAPAHALEELLNLVQYHVATYMNNTSPGILPATVRGSSDRALKSIGQRLKGKEGRVRVNLMGKRVDFTARTVITPDPNLELFEVGVPYAVARNLTYPEVVTPYNNDKLLQLVQNGPHIYPGANYIERKVGCRVSLAYMRNRSDLQLELGYKVMRHLQDGDYVVFNRQPSLHKMSIMGHRVRVMRGSTFRLNLSVTSPYNADFDGDEMNLHVPQSEMARAEVRELMFVPKCIVSPQGNKLVMGIVQDALLGCMLLTYRDTFLERDFMMNMLMHVRNWDGIVPDPAILKPKALWTGKQIFSLIIPDVNMVRTNNTHPDEESSHISPGDTKVYIVRGELIYGIVDKETVGPSTNGLIHITWKEYGPCRCSQLISDIQNLVNHFVLHRGQSIGIGDTIADAATMKNVIKTIQGAKNDVKDLILKLQRGDQEALPGKTLMQSFETEVNTKLNGARDQSGSSAQKCLLVSNNLKRKVSAGSKGSVINISQVCACVGQKNVEGVRISYGFRRRTLPHFVLDDQSPESRGFVENSYLRGLTPSEFFFHAMGGREGLIDTAVKTAETGYIQPRLIKSMEDVKVHYDGTVRNSGGHIVEFLYGEDAMDGAFVEDQVLRSLKMGDDKLKEDFKFDPAAANFGKDKYDQPYLMEGIVESVQADAAVQLALVEEFEEIKRDRAILRQVITNGEAKRPLPVNLDRLIWNVKQNMKIGPNSVSDLKPEAVLEMVKLLLQRTKVIDREAGLIGNNVTGDMKTKIDLLVREAQYNATLLFSIHVRAILCCKKVIYTHRLTMRAFVWLSNEIEEQFKKCRCPPGEMIGALAAQSIGEPATQMTLNTFHYAGVSAKNVTLGVPRLNEIINVTKNPKTPSLTIFLQPDWSSDQENAKPVASELQHTTLRDVMKVSEVYYDPDVRSTVIDADKELVEDYYESELQDMGRVPSPWLLRIDLDPFILEDRCVTMDHVQRKIVDCFGSDLQVICSQENDSSKVIRLRIMSEGDKDVDLGGGNQNGDPEEEDEDSDGLFLQRIDSEILAPLTLSGVTSIKKVFMRSIETSQVDPSSGEYKAGEEWVLDTDGVNLQACMSHIAVDHSRILSNNVCEIMEVLGIEAARACLLLEIHSIISFDDAYVNHRHLAILVDSMTHRGHLMVMARTGINRVETGPLMQCSFEETTDILLGAAMGGMRDPLHGVSGNIMLGQMAPIGTGSFSLFPNETMLKDVAEPAYNAVENTLPVARPFSSPGGGEIGAGLGDWLDRLGSNWIPHWSNWIPRATPGSNWIPRATPGTTGRAGQISVRGPVTPSAVYSSTHWGATPGRSESFPLRGQMSSAGAGVDFSPIGGQSTRRGVVPAYHGGNWAASPSGGDGTWPNNSGSGGGASPFVATDATRLAERRRVRGGLEKVSGRFVLSV